LLLDRKRINKWAKWVALGLAIIFAASFLFLGVGYGGAGFNLSELFTGDDNSTNTTLTADEKVAALEAKLQQNPKDVTTLLELATVYQQNGDLLRAAAYLDQVIAVDPDQKEVYLRLANIYLNQEISQYAAAAAVLNKATSVDPDNPDVYLKLGIAQNALGNTSATVLAWQKYLALAPNGDMASIVREQLAKLTQQATTTTTSVESTTTTAASPSTTAGSTVTTSGSITSTTTVTTAP
jgi:cytochrome c-type biogenesis protein CcmH/NrfG